MLLIKTTLIKYTLSWRISTTRKVIVALLQTFYALLFSH